MMSQGSFDRWQNLVVETQYATELILSGIRKICEVPTAPGFSGAIGYSEKYPLSIALHMYTSGLERLCKLTLACYGFLDTGEFSKVRKYSHGLSSLLDAVEALDFSKIKLDPPRYHSRPIDEYEDELITWLERYATGTGRYEIIDSLSNNRVEVLTWEIWTQLCSIGVVSENVKRSIGLRYVAARAVSHAVVEQELELSAEPMLEAFDVPLSEEASAVGIAMYRRARWVAATLIALTHYTSEGLPILSEVLYALQGTSDGFYTAEVARISDEGPVSEELGEYYGAHDVDGADDFDEPA